MGRQLGLLAMVALTAAAIGCTPADANDATVTITHQGVPRTATLHRPTVAASQPMPIMIVLHGIDQTNESLRRWIHVDATADRAGFIAVYPEAIERRWVYGQPIDKPMPTVKGETVDDVGFIRALIDDLVEKKIADPARVYVSGMSRGGLMTYAVACALSDRIAGAAPLIAGMTDHQRDNCHPARPVPMMVVAGTNDPGEWYDGVLAPAGRMLSIPETMEFWRRLQGCAQESFQVLPHRVSSDATRLRLITWSGCNSGVSLRLYRVDNGGHQVPSLTASSPSNTKQYGPRNLDMETSDEVWNFVGKRGEAGAHQSMRH